MRKLRSFYSGLQRRLRSALCEVSLERRRRKAGGTAWVDHPFMALPFHGDGDKQEILYHLHGARWWEAEKRLLQPFINPGDTVIDIGANLGFMTALFSNLCGPTGRVHSFEPSPTVFSKLEAVVARNGLQNVSVHNLGCGDRAGGMVLHLSESSGNASLRARGPGQETRTQKVEIVVLDDFFGKNPTRLDFLKVDTEGFEDSVLLGATGLLRRFKPTVYVELSAEYLDSSRAAVSLLKSLDYAFINEPDFSKVHMGDNFLAVPHKAGPISRFEPGEAH
jgi:FkbM family methyltransferase